MLPVNARARRLFHRAILTELDSRANSLKWIAAVRDGEMSGRFERRPRQLVLLSGLRRKLPKWVDERLEEATSVQIERWSKTILTTGATEGLLGMR